MKFEKVINISFNDLSAWQGYLDGKGDGGLNTVKTFTADIGPTNDGDVTIDIKVCDGEGSPFVDAVLFFDGNESGSLEVRDTLAGEYSFYNPNVFDHTYVVVIPDSIKAAEEGQKKYRAVEQWLQLLENSHIKAIDFALKDDNRMVHERGYTIESILERCADDNDILDKYYEQSQGNCSRLRFIADNKSPQCFPKSTMERVVISMDTRSDRECPYCQSKEIQLQDPRLKHERTELSLSGYCKECGCDFVFTYTLFVSDIQYT